MNYNFQWLSSSRGGSFVQNALWRLKKKNRKIFTQPIGFIFLSVLMVQQFRDLNLFKHLIYAKYTQNPVSFVRRLRYWYTNIHCDLTGTVTGTVTRNLRFWQLILVVIWWCYMTLWYCFHDRSTFNCCTQSGDMYSKIIVHFSWRYKIKSTEKLRNRELWMKNQITMRFCQINTEQILIKLSSKRCVNDKTIWSYLTFKAI